ncbi:MAG TPA: hypothetical protein VIK33_03890 [Anaerolineae bacterium]
MPETPPSAESGAETNERSGGVNIDGERVAIGGDAVGRDKISAGRDVTHIDDRDEIHIGFSEKAVVRLVLMVGGLVFVTAAVFFVLGAVVAGNVLASLDRDPRDASGALVSSSPEAAQDFLLKLSAAQNDQSTTLAFSEDELSSFFKFIAGDAIGLSDSRARFAGPNRVALSGRLARLGNLNVVVTFSLHAEPGRVFQLESGAAQLLSTGGPFGWVAVPNVFLQSFADDVNRIFGGLSVASVGASSAWEWNLQTGP